MGYRDPADEWLRADAERRGLPHSCTHEPACRTALAHYEREYGLMVAGGPTENRIRYSEVPAGLMGQGELAVARLREKRYTPERNEKRRRPRSRRRSPKAA